MNEIKPYAGKSNDRLTTLINADNRLIAEEAGEEYVDLVEGVDFTYGIMAAAVGPGGRNTKIEIIPTDLDNFTTSTPGYTRLSIDTLSQLPEDYTDPLEILTYPFSIHDILDEINAALGLDLTPEEVVNTVINTPAMRHPLTINATSVAWIASTYNFRTTFSATLNLENGFPLLLENGQPFLLEIA